MNREERLYRKLDKLLGGIEKFCSNPEAYAKFQSSGYMDLNIDNQTWKVGKELLEQGVVRISMAHNSVQNGDLMADPDMEINFSTSTKQAFAVSFQNDYIGVYTPAEKTINDKLCYDLDMIQSMNSFLEMWLQNIEVQGFERTE